MASIASSLLCSGFAFTLSRGPGWKDLRWFGWSSLFGAGYAFFTLPENGVGPAWWVPLGSSFALTAGGAHLSCWLRYMVAMEGRELHLWDRLHIGALALAGIAGAIPGLLLEDPVTSRPNGWWGGEHRDASPTVWGWVVFLAYMVALTALVFQMVRSGLRGNHRMRWPAVGISLALVSTVHDTLASSRAYVAPSLTELAIFGTLAAVLLGITARTAEDAAALVRSRAELERTQGELVERERLAALGELSAVVAHEVRNPLAVIYGAVATLQRKATEPEVRDSLGIVQQEAERLNKIVGDLLQLARPSTPRVQETQTESLLEDAARAAVRALGHEPDVVAISVEPSARLFDCDSAMMHHAVTNLMINALQAEGRKGQVEVRALTDGEAVEIRVSDDGHGVPQDAVPRLFTPFFTTRAKGTGLGLALVAKVAKGHGGFVRYEAGVNGGATFVVGVPRSHK